MSLNPKRWRVFILAGIAGIGLAGLVMTGGAFFRTPSDPVIEGKRMSEWAFGLIEQQFHKGTYGVPRTNLMAFSANRDAAISWLDRALKYRRSKLHVLWGRCLDELPSKLAGPFRPKERRIANRWAAVLALSSLAKGQPSERICQIVLDCMDGRDRVVRKVAAYEAGPWLCPHDHTHAREILVKALADDQWEVRRDACRRISDSATNTPPSYALVLLSLRPRLQQLWASDPQVRSNASVALARLNFSDLSPDRKMPAE